LHHVWADLGEINNKKTGELVHLKLQSGNTKDMALRMLE
jgi:hypothetical protein